MLLRIQLLPGLPLPLRRVVAPARLWLPAFGALVGGQPDGCALRVQPSDFVKALLRQQVQRRQGIVP